MKTITTSKPLAEMTDKELIIEAIEHRHFEFKNKHGVDIYLLAELFLPVGRIKTTGWCGELRIMITNKDGVRYELCNREMMGAAPRTFWAYYKKFYDNQNLDIRNITHEGVYDLVKLEMKLEEDYDIKNLINENPWIKEWSNRTWIKGCKIRNKEVTN